MESFFSSLKIEMIGRKVYVHGTPPGPTCSTTWKNLRHDPHTLDQRLSQPG